MSRYFIEISFLGTNYSGWQIQSNANTIQAELEKALSILLKEDIITTGAGRTDSGVHASFFVAHFDSISENLGTNQQFIASLNDILPRDIAVKDLKLVTPEAHARFSAISRTYQYYISRAKNPFNIETAWYFKANLNLASMKQATHKLMKCNDFSSFSKQGSDVKTNICRIYMAEWEERENQLVFTIRADRFLRNMVRAIVGTLIEVGRERISPDEFSSIIEAKNRSAAGPSAPPEGLFLSYIEYPNNILL